MKLGAMDTKKWQPNFGGKFSLLTETDNNFRNSIRQIKVNLTQKHGIGVIDKTVSDMEKLLENVVNKLKTMELKSKEEKVSKRGIKNKRKNKKKTGLILIVKSWRGISNMYAGNLIKMPIILG